MIKLKVASTNNLFSYQYLLVSLDNLVGENKYLLLPFAACVARTVRFHLGFALDGCLF